MEDTAEIPARFTAGRKRELEDELAAAQQKHKAEENAGKQAVIVAQKQAESAQKVEQAAQRQLKAAQANETAAKATETRLKNQADLMKSLIDAEAKRQELESKAVDKVPFTLVWKPDPDLTAKIQDWIEKHVIEPFQKGLGGGMGDLQYLFKGLAGTKIPKDEIDDLTDSQRKAYEQGVNMGSAFKNMGTAMADIPGLLGKIADGLSKIVEWFNKLPDPAKGGILAVLGLQATTGLPALIAAYGGLMALGKALGILGPAISGFVGSVTGATGGLVSWLADTFGAGGILGILGAVTVGVNIGLWLDTKLNWGEQIQTWLNDVFNQAGTWLRGNAPKFVTDIITGIGDVFRGALTGLSNTLLALVFAIAGVMEGVVGIVVGGLIGLLTGKWEVFNTMINTAGLHLKVALLAIGDALGAFWSSLSIILWGIVALFQAIWEKLFGKSIIPDIEKGFTDFMTYLGTLGSQISAQIANLWTWMTTNIIPTLENIGASIWNSIITGLTGAITNNPLANYLRGALGQGTPSGGAPPAAPSKQSGGPILKEGIYHLHPGEHVLSSVNANMFANLLKSMSNMTGGMYAMNARSLAPAMATAGVGGGKTEMHLSFNFPPGIENADQQRLKSFMTDIANTVFAQAFNRMNPR